MIVGKDMKAKYDKINIDYNGDLIILNLHNGASK